MKTPKRRIFTAKYKYLKGQLYIIFQLFSLFTILQLCSGKYGNKNWKTFQNVFFFKYVICKFTFTINLIYSIFSHIFYLFEIFKFSTKYGRRMATLLDGDTGTTPYERMLCYSIHLNACRCGQHIGPVHTLEPIVWSGHQVLLMMLICYSCSSNHYSDYIYSIRNFAIRSFLWIWMVLCGI